MLRVAAVLSIVLALVTGSAMAQPVWEQVVGSAPGLLNGFGDPNNISIPASAVFAGRLYVATSNSVTGTEVWRTSNGTDWSQVNLNGFGSSTNTAATSMMAFGGSLFVGTENPTLGCQVWRSGDGTLWTSSAANGFGNSANEAALSMAVQGGYLYVGTSNDSAAEIWRSSDGTAWNPVAAPPSFQWRLCSMATFMGMLFAGTDFAEVWTTDGGVTWSPATPPGWVGNVYLEDALPMIEFEGELYVGYSSWEFDYEGGGFERTHDGVGWISSGWWDDYRPVSASVFDGSLFVGVGKAVWRTYQGSWLQWSDEGFGDLGNASPSALATFGDHLYAGTYNSQGCEVWRMEREQPLFADGFESGDTSAWTSSTG